MNNRKNKKIRLSQPASTTPLFAPRSIHPDAKPQVRVPSRRGEYVPVPPTDDEFLRSIAKKTVNPFQRYPTYSHSPFIEREIVRSAAKALSDKDGRALSRLISVQTVRPVPSQGLILLKDLFAAFSLALVHLPPHRFRRSPPPSILSGHQLVVVSGLTTLELPLLKMLPRESHGKKYIYALPQDDACWDALEIQMKASPESWPDVLTSRAIPFQSKPACVFVYHPDVKHPPRGCSIYYGVCLTLNVRDSYSYVLPALGKDKDGNPFLAIKQHGRILYRNNPTSSCFPIAMLKGMTPSLLDGCSIEVVHQVKLQPPEPLLSASPVVWSQRHLTRLVKAFYNTQSATVKFPEMYRCAAGKTRFIEIPKKMLIGIAVTVDSEVTWEILSSFSGSYAPKNNKRSLNGQSPRLSHALCFRAKQKLSPTVPVTNGVFLLQFVPGSEADKTLDQSLKTGVFDLQGDAQFVVGPQMASVVDGPSGYEIGEQTITSLNLPFSPHLKKWEELQPGHQYYVVYSDASLRSGLQRYVSINAPSPKFNVVYNITKNEVAELLKYETTRIPRTPFLPPLRIRPDIRPDTPSEADVLSDMDYLPTSPSYLPGSPEYNPAQPQDGEEPPQPLDEPPDPDLPPPFQWEDPEVPPDESMEQLQELHEKLEATLALQQQSERLADPMEHEKEPLEVDYSCED
jgi:hypothetical protein